ncbi:hypothetical protein J2T17_000797, partial [Paenibacillus mucilaginosus]|uniref:transposase n=1 Tax=Paenibacillus mucilaginosus TaxID=61624 RepID=UPI003D195D93
DSKGAAVTCPAGQIAQKKNYNRHLEGTQYSFPKQVCQTCSLREQCTTSVKGRTVFISDYYNEFQEAKEFNETEKAKKLFQMRNAVERKNNELKNHNGLGHARTYTRERRRVYVKIVSMVVNLKQLVKQRNPLTLGFVRKRPPCLLLPVLQIQ